MDQKSTQQEQGKANAMTLALQESNKSRAKEELVKRLTHIQHLAKQKNYARIKKLLQEGYV